MAVDPVTETVYHAVKGGGFFINGQRHAVETMPITRTLTWHADRSLSIRIMRTIKPSLTFTLLVGR